ncbi:GldG family protein, partial [Candidatus Parcubacteria bacterium]|nr:GldG family protein [Candidatus Parcubacteria bacterium]
MNFNKKLINKTNLSITVLIIIGILAVINFFSYQIFHRWDLTQNKDYSISKVSKRTVGELDDIVNIKVYFSKNLPSQYITLHQEVGDILDEYVNYSNGKIRVEFIDPADDEDLAQKLMMIGIPELQFNVFEKDKMQIVRGYLGMAIQYGDKNEVIPVVQGTQNLEYQVTLAIKKVTSEEMATVGFVTSNGTASLENEISAAYKSLQELYQVRQVDLSTVEQVPPDINTLIIIGPKEPFEEEQLKAIDAHLCQGFGGQGGSLLILVDGVKVEEGMIASVNNVGLDGLLENYGIKLNHNLVLDVSNSIASFTQGFFTFSTNYPFWPKVVKDGFDQENAAVAKLESLVLPWASSLEVLTDKINENNKVSYLARTTNRAWSQDDNFNLNPQQMFAPSNGQRQLTLAVSVFGKFNSVYDDGKTGVGRLIVVGDSDFIKDSFARNNPNNLIFFQNLVDSLSLDEDLINIRSKGITDRPIKELSDGQKAAIRYLNIFGLT